MCRATATRNDASTQDGCILHAIREVTWVALMSCGVSSTVVLMHAKSGRALLKESISAGQTSVNPLGGQQNLDGSSRLEDFETESQRVEHQDHFSRRGSETKCHGGKKAGKVPDLFESTIDER